MLQQIKPGPLDRAIDQRSAEWLEANDPVVFDALYQELTAGQSLNDIKQILRRKFGDDQRDAFVMRVVQATRYLISERVSVGQ